MKKLLLTAFLLVTSILCAQEVKVESFVEDLSDLSAVVNETFDANGKSCALLKIMILDKSVSFKSDWIIKSEEKGQSEFWVWLCEGTQNIIVKSDNFLPLEVFFADYASDIKALKGKHTYVLRIGIEKVQEPMVDVVFQCNISNVQLYIDGDSVSKGTMKIKLTPGSHKVLARANNYEDFERTFNVSQYTSRQEVRVTMNKISTNSYDLVKKANAYMNGTGVKKDYAEAYKYNKLAADKKEPAAYANLGVMYYNGWGVTQDDREAVKWWKMAAQQNVALAQSNLGYMYENGLGGLPKNQNKAFEYFMKAAKQNDVNGMYNVGSCYLDGKGVNVNYAEALKWLRKSADEQYSMAQYALGRMYEFGLGVSVNNAEAIRMYSMAVEQDNMYAMNSLARMYYLGSGVEKNSSEAARLWRKAAIKGMAEAQMNIGGCYEEGEGVTKDIDIAVKYYRMAAAAGFQPAKDALKRLGK